MLISEKIHRYLPETEIEIKTEKDVDSLGFISSTGKSFCGFIGSAKYISDVSDDIKTLIIGREIKEQFSDDKVGLIISDKPQMLFWKLHQSMGKDSDYIRLEQNNRISGEARIGKYVSIADKNVVIEEGVVIEDFVTIYENTYIGKNSIVRSGCRLGGVGFQECMIDDKIETINHYGGVIIGENVDIQNNSCIDRGLFPWDDTVIGDETKIDNMVHIAHAVSVGKRCEIAANSVIAGRCKIGDNVWIGLGALIRNFAVIGNDSRVNIGSVVVNDVPDGGNVTGNFAIDHNKFLYSQLRLNRIK